MEDDIEVKASVSLLISVEEMSELSIGSLNLTQVLQTLFTALSPIFDNIQTFITVFAHAQPTWHCTTTTTSTSTTNTAMPCISNKSDVCLLSKTEWAWDYHDSGINTSIVSEWGLECASSFITGFPTTCYFVGCLLGGLVLATLGDSSLGRKNLLCTSSLVMSLAALASAFSPNIWVYSVLRFVCGVARAPLAMCALVLYTERVSKQWRSQATMVGCIMASLGILGLACIADLAKESSWRSLYLLTSIPGIIFSISAFFFMYESPRWLILQGRNQEAIDILTSLGSRISNTNSEIAIRYIEQINGSNTPFASLRILVDRKWAVMRLVECMLLAFGIGVMYFGMFLGVEDLGFDIYLGTIFHALLNMFSSLFSFLVCVPYCNRRVSLLGFCILSGITSIVLSIISNNSKPMQGLVVGMELVSMCCGCVAYNTNLIYTVELFPTCVRSTALSLVRQAMILGSAFDPMLVLLGSENMVYSYGVFGLAILVCGFLVLGLPETRGKVMCDTMEEQELKDNERIHL